MYSWGNSTRWNNKNSSYFVAKPLLLETPRKSWRIWFPILVTGFQIVSSSGLPVSHLCVHNAPDVLSGSQVWDVPMCPRTISHFDSDHRIIFHFPSVCLKRAQVWRRAFCSSLNNILFVFVNAFIVISTAVQCCLRTQSPWLLNIGVLSLMCRDLSGFCESFNCSRVLYNWAICPFSQEQGGETLPIVKLERSCLRCVFCTQ